MDPNTTIASALALADAIFADDDALADDYQRSSLESKATQLAEHMQAIDAWLAAGGFLPTRWLAGRTR